MIFENQETSTFVTFAPKRVVNRKNPASALDGRTTPAPHHLRQEMGSGKGK